MEAGLYLLSVFLINWSIDYGFSNKLPEKSKKKKKVPLWIHIDIFQMFFFFEGHSDVKQSKAANRHIREAGTRERPLFPAWKMTETICRLWK